MTGQDEAGGDEPRRGGPPPRVPIGLQLSRTARTVTQAFERALAEAGGSVAGWQVLLLVRSRQWDTQSELAHALNVTSATLTHHLNAMEAQGLVRRWREPDNRRVQRVELTDAGVELFDRLRAVATTHDARLRAALGDEDAAALGDLLARLEAGIATPPPRTGSRGPAR
jgi:MarR family transcriptional regulator for hemolysin